MSIWPKPTPTPPSTRLIAVNTRMPVHLADVRLDDGDTLVKRQAGPQRIEFPSCPAKQYAFNLHVRADGYKPYDRVVSVPSGGVDIIFDPWPNLPNPQQVIVPAMERARPVPTREAVCAAIPSWQGVCRPDGSHFWDLDLARMTTAQRAEMWPLKRADGNMHCMISLDLRGLGSLPDAHALALEALDAGFYIQLMCMGDGNDPGEPDHDTGALGWSWVMTNFPAIYEAFADIAEYCVFVPGFDGVVPAWQPFTRVNQFVQMARSVIDHGGKGYLGLELSAGYMSWTGEDNVWATDDGKMVDVIIQEFPIGMDDVANIPPDLLNADGTWKATTNNEQRAPWTQVYQVVGRMVQPYHVPAKQPDDRNPPYMLGAGTPRGSFFYIAAEQSTYEWVRNAGMPLALVQSRRAYLRSLGCAYVA